MKTEINMLATSELKAWSRLRTSAETLKLAGGERHICWQPHNNPRAAPSPSGRGLGRGCVQYGEADQNPQPAGDFKPAPYQLPAIRHHPLPNPLPEGEGAERGFLSGHQIASRVIFAKQRGFTLVEISIVLVIIGTILFALLKSQSVISSAKAKDVVAIINDIRTATTYFQKRYSYLPGDLPNPANYINAVPVLVAGTGGAIGNGAIEGAVNATGQGTAGSEVAQAPWQLFHAGLIGTLNSATPTNYLNTSFGPVQIVSNATANGRVPGFTAANPAARNAILFFSLPCDVANEVDVKVDDGNLRTGTGLGSAACTGTNILPVYAITL